MTSLDFLKRFWAWGLSLLGVVGGYLALEQAEIGWVIFVIAGIAALLALIRPGLDALSKVRRFPRVIADLNQTERDLETAKAALAGLEERADERFDAGVAEGRAEILGALLASDAEAAPEMVAVGISESKLVITGRYASNPIPKGARYQVEVEATGEGKGVVEAVLVDAEAELVHMECVRRDAEQFWDALEQRAIEDPSPPRGVRLAPLVVDLPPTLRDSAQATDEPETQETA